MLCPPLHPQQQQPLTDIPLRERSSRRKHFISEIGHPGCCSAAQLLLLLLPVLTKDSETANKCDNFCNCPGSCCILGQIVTSQFNKSPIGDADSHEKSSSQSGWRWGGVQIRKWDLQDKRCNLLSPCAIARNNTMMPWWRWSTHLRSMDGQEDAASSLNPHPPPNNLSS